MDLVQLLGQLLAQSGGQEGLAFVVLLVVLGGVITQVDVHCRQQTQSDRSTIRPAGSGQTHEPTADAIRQISNRTCRKRTGIQVDEPTADAIRQISKKTCRQWTDTQTDAQGNWETQANRNRE